MGCDVSREQLWSWVDREAPELGEHVAECAECRRRTEVIRHKMRVIAAGSSVVIPDRIGRYRVRHLLGEGGQALVYEADPPDLDRPVALKVLKGGRFASEKLVKSFRRETQALARLQHPCIATIFEAGHTDEGLHYFAMEKVDGVPLNSWFDEQGATRDRRLKLFEEICRAVDHAHRRGVIHRDLKPSNIIVDRTGTPRILDFGLARLTRAGSGESFSVTRTGLIAGTPRYMSPEQARGNPRAIDARSDVYSLGVILYELLTGRPPHDIADLTPAALRTLNEEDPRRPSSIDRTVSPDLDSIVLKALERDPARRYRTVGELAEDIRSSRESLPIRARPPSLTHRLRRKLGRRRHWIGVAVIALAGALIAGFWPRDRDSLDTDRARLAALHIRAGLLAPDRSEADVERAINATELYRQLPEARLLRAQAEYLRGRPQVAASWLQTLIEREPGEWRYRVLLAEVEEARDGTETQRSDVWEQADVRRDSAEAWFRRSFATLDVHRALAWAEEAVRLDSDHSLAMASLALMSPIAGDNQGAVGWATKLVEGNHDPTKWLQYNVRILFGAERFEEALAECDRWVARAPGDRQAWLSRARTLRRLKRYDEATRDLTRAIEMGGGDSATAIWVYFHRGTLNWMLGRDEQAMSDYNRTDRALSYATYANARLFVVQNEQGQPVEAREALAEARRRVSGRPWLGKVLACLAGDLEPEQLVAAAAGPVQQVEAFYYAGEACLLHGRRDEALAWFRACVATGLDSDPEEFWEPMSEHELAEWRLSDLQDSPGLEEPRRAALE